LFEKGWKENGIKNQKRAKEFLENYRYSSYQDLSLLTNRPEARILDMDNLPEDVSRVTLDIREYQKWYKSGK